MSIGDDIKAAYAARIKEVEYDIRATVSELAEETINDTPYDKGYLQNSWMVLLNVKPSLSDVSTTTTPGGAAAKLQVADAMAGFKLGDTIHFANMQPYAAYVEFGTAHQRPQLMLSRALDAWAHNIKEALGRL